MRKGEIGKRLVGSTEGPGEILEIFTSDRVT